MRFAIKWGYSIFVYLLAGNFNPMKHRCMQTWVPLRRENTSTSEMVSSLLFGETCSELKRSDDWLYVQCDYDGYEGWIPENYLEPISLSDAPWNRILASQSAFYSDGISRIHLSAGSNLPPTDSLIINGHEFYLTIRDPRVPEHAWQLARGFAYVPYLWGGRSDCGIDCSGLTQIVAKMKGIFLPRDAWQQEQTGLAISWADRKPNDLVFFEKNERVTHVGILSSYNTVIHASGRVREDKISEEGIFDSVKEEYSHKLVSIKRQDFNS